MRFVLTAPVLAIALAAAATPAALAADNGEETVTVRVDIADLDLASADDRAALEARVDAQLRDACTTSSRYTYGRAIVDEKCLADARSEVIAQVERIAVSEARAGGAVSAN